MRLLGPLVMLVVLAGCGGDDERAGSPEVFAQIEASADCAGLQETFDRAEANHDRAEPGSEQSKWTLEYMKAAENRRQELGC